MSIYSEDRRKDPEIRKLVAEMLQAQNKALTEAGALISQAMNLLVGAEHGTHGASEVTIYQDALDGVVRAKTMLTRALNHRGDPTNGTYVGNLAASPVGAILKEHADELAARAKTVEEKYSVPDAPLDVTNLFSALAEGIEGIEEMVVSKPVLLEDDFADIDDSLKVLEAHIFADREPVYAILTVHVQDKSWGYSLKSAGSDKGVSFSANGIPTRAGVQEAIAALGDSEDEFIYSADLGNFTEHELLQAFATAKFIQPLNDFYEDFDEDLAGDVRPHPINLAKKPFLTPEEAIAEFPGDDWFSSMMNHRL